MALPYQHLYSNQEFLLIIYSDSDSDWKLMFFGEWLFDLSFEDPSWSICLQSVSNQIKLNHLLFLLYSKINYTIVSGVGTNTLLQINYTQRESKNIWVFP